jgi:hypothetical protein
MEGLRNGQAIGVGDPDEHNLDNVGGDQGKSIDPEKIFAFGMYLSATGHGRLSRA